MRIDYLDEAIDELSDAAVWIDEQAGLGDDFRRELAMTLKSISLMPDSFARHEFVNQRRWPNVRRAVIKRFSIVIAFDVRSDAVLILAAYHSSRRPKYWIKRLKSLSSAGSASNN